MKEETYIKFSNIASMLILVIATLFYVTGITDHAIYLLCLAIYLKE